jgi:hypothetical protein
MFSGGIGRTTVLSSECQIFIFHSLNNYIINGLQSAQTYVKEKIHKLGLTNKESELDALNIGIGCERMVCDRS